ncbi:MAG: lipopolysaccharide biosynthesis protein, partial [Thomasclavelia spiroformis]
IMVTSMIGTAANGIYAVSYKIPTLMSVFTSIFNQAWGYSAIKEDGATDELDYNNKVLRLLVAFTMLIAIGLITITKPFLSLYVAKAYYEAWKYVPFLLIGSVYMTFGTFFASSYTVHKDSFGYLFSGSFGAIFNIALNFILIPIIGVFGAAVATCISYIMVFVFRLVHTRKYLKYNVYSKEFVVGSLFLVLDALALYLNGSIGVIVQFIILIIVFIIYGKSLIPIFTGLINKLKRKN